MDHATDGLLLAYHDGEIDGLALAELREHLSVCAQCTRELDELRRSSGAFHEAVALGDVPAPAVQPMRPATAAAAAVRTEGMGLPLPARRPAAWTRLGLSGLAKAALFLLAFTGVLTAIPGSPARRAVESLLDRLFDRPAAPEMTVRAAPTPTPHGLKIDPAAGHVRVVVQDARDVDVTVELVEAARASVDAFAVGHDVKLTSGPGRAEVSGMGVRTLRIGLPRDVRRATVEVDGHVLVRLVDGVLQLEGPAGSARGEQVSFRIAP